MKLGLIYTLALICTLSAHSAELVKQKASTTITAEGKHFLCQDMYDKLLAISGTLQNDNAEHGTPNPVYFPNIQKPYYEIGHDTQYLQHIIDYISTDNTHEYLTTLSPTQLIHLYQNADYWNLDARLLHDLQTYITIQLQNKDVLTQILSTQESLDTFLNACNSQTKFTLTKLLWSCICNFFWPLITKPQQTLDHAENVISITELAAHTDGTLFSISPDRSNTTLRVWKKNTRGQYYCTQTLTGHTRGGLNSVAVHTDGTLFSGSYDNTIHIWKTDAQGQYYYMQTLAGHTGAVKSVVVNTDGTLFSGSYDNTIRIWKKNVQGFYECVKTLTDHAYRLNTFAVRSDGTLFSCSYHGVICIWKKNAQDSYECVQILEDHTYGASLAVHTDGTLFSCSRETINVWKPNSQDIYHCKQTLTDHTSRAENSLTVYTDGTLFSGSNDGTIYIWKKDIQGNYDCVQILKGHIDSVRTMAVHIDGYLFSGSDDRKIHIWKLPRVPLLSLEQSMAVIHCYNLFMNNYSLFINNKKYFPILPDHIQAIYNTFPDSIKNLGVPKYKSLTILSNWNIQPLKLYARSKYSYKKLLLGGLTTSIVGAGCYLYYKWFRK
ncbi:WD40 repeat domain-containing protein [Vermiphilus pyriformis]|nr:MAG: WD40 repeat domain-containing protein [Vermiphilus pyriformis]